MYNDVDEVTYTVAAAAAGGVPLKIQQTMDAEDMCAIFDDAWLGSRVWEATTSFCDRLCGSNGLESPLVAGLVGSSVLELGAGTGIVGLVAAALGAGEVVTTDMASPDGTLNLIRHNIQANLDAITQSARACHAAAGSGAAETAPNLRGAALDWTQPPSAAWRAEFEPADGFDTILAAECDFVTFPSFYHFFLSFCHFLSITFSVVSSLFPSFSLRRCIYTGIDSGSTKPGQEKRPVWSALADTICCLATE